MKVVIKEPNKKGYIKDIEDDLNEYQKIVGGYIEVLYHFTRFEKNLLVISNEAGKILGLDFNFYLSLSDYLAGTCIFLNDNLEGGFCDITQSQLSFLKENEIIE